jgi:hypothetical protein
MNASLLSLIRCMRTNGVAELARKCRNCRIAQIGKHSESE